MGQDEQSNLRTGALSAAAAYTLWGFLPLYFIVLRDVQSDEILTHRIIWSVPFGALILTARGQWPEVLRGIQSARVILLLALAAFLIALNWLTYIAAVQSGNIFEAALGYYINPLVYVLVGVVVLKERLRPYQIAAVVMATIGVSILTLFGGKFPVISFILASSFTAYGYIRKRINIGAMPGLFLETTILAPVALLYLTWLATTGAAAIVTGGPGTIALLTLAGPVTVVPLLFFAIGARRLPLATLGFLQFIGPTLQFIIGMISGEPFTTERQICMMLIWVAAGLFAYDAWKRRPKNVPKTEPGLVK